MTLESIVTKMCEHVDTLLVAITPAGNPLAELLGKIEWVRCSAEEFTREVRAISCEEARILVGATLHRSMAFSSFEYMPLDRARDLASAFVAQLGVGAKFYSTCGVPDHEAAGVGGWYFQITKHTFESVLYCVGTQQAALLVAIEED